MPEKINKMPEFYTIFARKKFLPEFVGGGATGATAPLPPSPMPMLTALTYVTRF